MGGGGGGCYTERDDAAGQRATRRTHIDKAKEPPYQMDRVHEPQDDLAGSVIVRPPTRKAWFQCVTEMLLLCNEAARRSVKRGTMVHKKDANGVQSKPLGLEYMVDRIDLDDPLTGYMVRTEKEGWLQGFITVTTFMTWHRDFEWNSLIKESGISDEDKLNRAWDSDGALAKGLMALPRQQLHPTRKKAFVSPRVAEISLLGGLGCGAKLLQLVLDDLEQQDEYDFVVLQATDNAIGFYEKMGFVRVGAVTKAYGEFSKRPGSKGQGKEPMRRADEKSTKKAKREHKGGGSKRSSMRQDDGWRKWCEIMLQRVLAMPEAHKLMHARASPLMLEFQRCVDLVGVADALRVLHEDEQHLYEVSFRQALKGDDESTTDPTAWIKRMRLPRYGSPHDFCFDMRLVLEAMVRDPNVALEVKEASVAVFQAFRQSWISFGAIDPVIAIGHKSSEHDAAAGECGNISSKFYIRVDLLWQHVKGFRLLQVFDVEGEPGRGSNPVVKICEWTVAFELAPFGSFAPDDMHFVLRQPIPVMVEWKPRFDGHNLPCDSWIAVSTHFVSIMAGDGITPVQCVRVHNLTECKTAAYTKLFAVRALELGSGTKQVVPVAPRPSASRSSPSLCPTTPTKTGRAAYRCSVCGLPKSGHTCPGKRVVGEALQSAPTQPALLPEAPPPPPPSQLTATPPLTPTAVPAGASSHTLSSADEPPGTSTIAFTPAVRSEQPAETVRSEVGAVPAEMHADKDQCGMVQASSHVKPIEMDVGQGRHSGDRAGEKREEMQQDESGDKHAEAVEQNQHADSMAKPATAKIVVAERKADREADSREDKTAAEKADDKEHTRSASMLAPKKSEDTEVAMEVRENEPEKDEDKAARSDETEKSDEQEKPDKEEQDEEEEEEEEMSEYELKRLKRMEENKRLMLATGILQLTKDISAAAKPRDLAEEKRRKMEKKLRDKPQVNQDQIRKLRTRVAKPIETDLADDESIDQFIRSVSESDRARSRVKKLTEIQSPDRLMEMYRTGPEMTRPFNWFVKQMTPRLRVQFPHLQQNDIMKLVGSVWRGLSLDDRNKWDMERPGNSAHEISALAEATLASTAPEGEHAAHVPPNQPSTPSVPAEYTTEVDGEHVAHIASRWHLDLDLLVEMNRRRHDGINHKARLKKGTCLKLPKPGERWDGVVAESWVSYCHWTYPDQSVSELFPSYMMVKRIERGGSKQPDQVTALSVLRSRCVAVPPPMRSCETVQRTEELQKLKEERIEVAKATGKLRFSTWPEDGWHACKDSEKVSDVAAGYGVSASILVVINRGLISGLTRTAVLKPGTRLRLGGPTLQDSDEEWFQGCLSVLHQLADSEDALPFMEAVDWESRELLEYPFVVSMPMDLKTLEEKLCDGFYKSADEFARDARLVFANVLSFNSPENQVYAQAEKMKAFFEDKWTEHGFQDAPPPQPSAVAKRSTGAANGQAPAKRQEMYNKVVRVPGEEAAHAFYFVLHYVPDLHWCHLAPLRQDGFFPEFTRQGKPHPHMGKKRWRLLPEGASKELDVSGDRCIIVRSKTVNSTQDADKELWCIEEDEDSPLQSRKERERELARERKKNQRDRMKLMQIAHGASSAPGEWMSASPEVWMTECERLLGRLMRHSQAWPFNVPVDPVALKLPDYYDVVQTPMDLGTVQERLQEKAYKDPKEFVRDVMLTFDNALDYNPSENFVYKHAVTAMGYFKTLLKNSRILCHALSIPVGGNARSSGGGSGGGGSSSNKGSSMGGAMRAMHRSDRAGPRSLLDSWRSSRPSTGGAGASSRYANSHSLRDSNGRFIKRADRESQPPAHGSKGSRDQRHQRSILRQRDPQRAPKRRLDTDQHGRSIMPVLKRPHLTACNAGGFGQPGDGGSYAAKKEAEEPQDGADTDSLR